MEHNHDFISVIRLLGRPIHYYPAICHALDGDVRCAMFLSNFYFWEGKQDDAAGWIYKSQKEIRLETGLNRYSQEQARKRLKEFNIMEEKLVGKPPVMHYRFDWQKLNMLLQTHFNGGKPEKNAVDPLLFRMKGIFTDFYAGPKGTNGFAYEWPEGKAGGRDWKGLKELAEAFRSRLIDARKKRGESEDITDDEILHSFQMFLEMLPPFYLKNSLSPPLLYLNWNKIILELRKNGNGINKAGQPVAGPADYV